MFLKIFDLTWIEHHFLYFAYVGIGLIIIIVFLIGRHIHKDIKRIDENSRKKMVDFMRETSKHNKKERKKLKF